MSNRKQLQAQLNQLQKQANNIAKQLEDIDDVESGDKPSPAQAKLIATQAHSYGVRFLRRKALKKVRSPGAVCVSQRRFTSRKEACQHAKRFAKKHRHSDFSIVIVHKRANAWINWKTGKTNPAL